MPTITQNVQLIRQRLNEPGAQTPSDIKLLNLLVDHTTNHVNSLNNTQQHWSVGSWVLTTSSGEEDYPVGAANFGRPFLVYTQDLTNTYHVRSEVPFSLFQNTDQLYSGPQQTVSTYPHSAIEMVFYRQADSWYVRTVPIPNRSGDYVILYEVAYEFGAMGDTPGLTPFHNLIRVQTSLAALPLCAWGELNLKENPQGWKLFTDTLRLSLKDEEALFLKEFNQYKNQSTREGVGRRIGYGDLNYEDDWTGYGGRMIGGYGI